jgi:hypothetical protein
MDFEEIAMGLRWICEGLAAMIRSFYDDWATMKMRHKCEGNAND